MPIDLKINTIIIVFIGGLENWNSQYATSNQEVMGLRKIPYSFTEEDIYMLVCIEFLDHVILAPIAINSIQRLSSFSCPNGVSRK